jgi:hypothetical protein
MRRNASRALRYVLFSFFYLSLINILFRLRYGHAHRSQSMRLHARLELFCLWRLHTGIATGNPGVFSGYPYPNPGLSVPGTTGTGFYRYGLGLVR